MNAAANKPWIGLNGVDWIKCSY